MNMRVDYANSDRGVALILTMIAILVLTTIAVGIVLVTQTQVWTSYNYRLTVQARYAAEAGIQHTMNWIQNSYTAPASPPPASYITTAYPVSCTAAPCTGGSVVLSARSGVSSNYPDSTQQTAFNSALSSQSIPGISSATFSTYATLLQMSGGVSWLPGAGSGVTQTWQITSVGSVGGLRNASVQLQATYERRGTPIFTYGLAGDANSCGDITFTNGKMDAWNSAAGAYTATHQNSGGNIGTNGNVTLSGGSTTIGGTISSSSNITVGNCPDGITNNVGGTPWTGLQQLPTALSYSNPTVPSPMTPNVNINQNGSSSCDPSWPAGACTYKSSGVFSIAPNTPATGYGNLTANQNLHFSTGTYYFNSLQMNGGSITLDSTPVVINLGGNGIGSGNTLFATQSSTTINSGGIPANLQIVSACCTTAGAQMANPPVITMNASSSMYGIVYAPNSYVHITGSSQFLGAVISQEVTSDSSGGFSFDLALNNSLQQVGSFIPIGFSWSTGKGVAGTGP